MVIVRNEQDRMVIDRSVQDKIVIVILQLLNTYIISTYTACITGITLLHLLLVRLHLYDIRNKIKIIILKIHKDGSLVRLVWK